MQGSRGYMGVTTRGILAEIRAHERPVQQGWRHYMGVQVRPVATHVTDGLPRPTLWVQSQRGDRAGCGSQNRSVGHDKKSAHGNCNQRRWL